MAAPTTNCGWFYVKKPEATPKAADIFELRSMDVPEVKEGMVLVKTLGAVVAPHTRAFLELPGNDVGAEAAGLTRTKLGEVVPCELVAEVVDTKSDRYRIGDKVMGFVPLKQYWAFRADGKDQPSGNAPAKVMGSANPESVLNVSAGLTAYMVVNKHPCGRVDEPCCAGGITGCFSFLRPKPQKTVLITSAAGGVGIVAGQLYKNKGCKVVGVTSTRQKADRLKEFGFDAAIAYKEEDLDARLGEVAPEGIDVFFDNVGAAQLDIGSKHMKLGGKIVQVGCQAEIDNYATGNITGWKEYHRMTAREMLVGGFLLSNHMKEVPGAFLSLLMMQKRGKLKSVETSIQGGWEQFTECIDRLRTGDTFGRLILMFNDKTDPAVGA